MAGVAVDLRCHSQACKGAKVSVKVDAEMAMVRCPACGQKIEVPQKVRDQARAAQGMVALLPATAETPER